MEEQDFTLYEIFIMDAEMRSIPRGGFGIFRRLEIPQRENWRALSRSSQKGWRARSSTLFFEMGCTAQPMEICPTS